MQTRHVPYIGPRYWAALSIASILGANTGDFLASVVGLGHFKGLPILAVILAVILVVEARDRAIHEIYYWLAIVVIRTAATNIADFTQGDLKLPKSWVMTLLSLCLVAVVLYSTALSKSAEAVDGVKADGLPLTDRYYWIGMLLAGTLGTVLGDYVSFNSGLGLGLANSSLALSFLLVAWFIFGKSILQVTACYWFSIVLVRGAGTAVGDYLALKLGLPLSTALAGVLFVLTLVLWKDRQRVGPG